MQARIIGRIVAGVVGGLLLFLGLLETDFPGGSWPNQYCTIPPVTGCILAGDLSIVVGMLLLVLSLVLFLFASGIRVTFEFRSSPKPTSRMTTPSQEPVEVGTPSQGSSASWPCPYCGTWNVKGFSFCSKCGRARPGSSS